MRILLLFLVILYYCTTTYAQQSSFSFRHIGTNEGLSQSNVLCIFQDSKGFMWFGTRDGLNKYDAYNFKIYKNDPTDSTSIISNYIRKIKEDKDKNLWIGTFGGGLEMFDTKKEIFYHFKHDKNDANSLSNNNVYSIVVDKDGIFWIGTFGGGLNRFDPKSKKFTAYKNQEADSASISNNYITELIEDNNEKLWIGTENGGLNLFNKKTGKFKRYFKGNHKGAISDNYVRALLKDSKGTIWVGTNLGLNKYISLNDEFITYKHDPKNPNTICHNNILSLIEDKEGNIWIGTENGGISILNLKTEKFTHVNTDANNQFGLSHNSIYSFYRDLNENLWIGTFNGGLNIYNNESSKFKLVNKSVDRNSLSNNSVISFYEDSKDNFWICTDGGGLNLFNRKTGQYTYFKHDPNNSNSLSSNHVLGVTEDKEHNLWIGSWAGGLTKFEPENNTFTHYKHDPNDPNSISSNNVWLTKEDSKGNLWIATIIGGINRFDRKNNKFIRYQHNDKISTSISFNNSKYIYEDREGNIWIATEGGGLELYDPAIDGFKHYVHNPNDSTSLSNNKVSYITEDSKGNLWVGTYGGLNLFNKEKDNFTRFLKKDGLPNDVINGILEDSSGMLWISTNYGITLFDHKGGKHKTFDTKDGLQGFDFNHGACLKTKDGELFFGGPNGYNSFYPENVKYNETRPPLVFTNFHLFNKAVPIAEDSPLKMSISESKEIELSHKESVFSFEFSALNFIQSEKNQYAYMLEGFDKDWNNIGSNRSATYTNLDPGSYTLRIKGSNNDGFWNEEGNSMKITITPPFWLTWWFKLLSIVMVTAIIFSGYKARIEIINHQKRELERQVLERTSEVINQKEELQIQSETLEELYNEIKDSIRAAQNIQQSLLPTQKFIRKHLPESFILNKPKDVVSGDFCWFDVVNDQIVVAVVDCTGHGVSGAFMSINGHHLLNQSIYGNKKLIASEVLDKLNQGIIKALNHDDEEKDFIEGMDIALCIIDKENKKLQFAGANNPLYLIRNQELLQIKANKFSVGLSITGVFQKFSNHEVALQHGDIFYIFTDGYADQIGDSEGQPKFLYGRFRQLLLDIHQKDMDQQAFELEQNIHRWRGTVDQLDDIMILGFKV